MANDLVPTRRGPLVRVAEPDGGTFFALDAPFLTLQDFSVHFIELQPAQVPLQGRLPLVRLGVALDAQSTGGGLAVDLDAFDCQSLRIRTANDHVLHQMRVLGALGSVAGQTEGQEGEGGLARGVLYVPNHELDPIRQVEALEGIRPSSLGGEGEQGDQRETGELSSEGRFRVHEG